MARSASKSTATSKSGLKSRMKIGQLARKTGKTVRAVNNPVAQAWADSGLAPLPTPHQRVLMEDFKEAAMAAGRFELTMNAGGQGAGGIQRRRPAAEIFNDIVSETRAALDSLRAI